MPSWGIAGRDQEDAIGKDARDGEGEEEIEIPAGVSARHPETIHRAVLAVAGIGGGLYMMRTTGRPSVRRSAIAVSASGTSSNSTTSVVFGQKVPASSIVSRSLDASANIAVITSGG